MSDKLDHMYLTCVYCGKPNIHPERLYRYCTSDACSKDGQNMVFPKYATTAIINNTAEVMEHNSSLSEALQNALETIEKQNQDIINYKDTIVSLISDRRKALDAEIEVGRWDLIRLMISHHYELELGIDVGNADPNAWKDIYEQAYVILGAKLAQLGIERIGTAGEQVSVDHKFHDSYSKQGDLTRIIRPGYYCVKADYVPKKAVTIGENDIYPWSKDKE